MAETITTEASEAEVEQAVVDQYRKLKKKKTLGVVTYIIALLCLLAGLLVPLYQYGLDTGDMTDNMMIKWLLGMLNSVITSIGGSPLFEEPEIGGWFINASPYGSEGFDFASLIGVLYALTCVLAIIMLIPVLVGKKEKNTTANCALAVEIIAIFLITALVCYTIYDANKNGGITSFNWSDHNLLIALGGALLMGIIQSVASKGSIGVSKTIALIVTLLCVICILDIAAFIDALQEPIVDLSTSIECVPAFIGIGGSVLIGFDGIARLTDFDTLADIFEGDTMGIVAWVLLMFVCLMIVVNLLSDLIGLGTGKKFKADRSPAKNGASNTFALVRYILTFLVVAAMIVIGFVSDYVVQGIYMYLLEFFLLIQIINAAARTAVANKRYKQGKLAPATDLQDKIVIDDPTFAGTAEPKSLPAPTPEPQLQPEQPAYQQPYSEPYYQQPAYEQPQPVYQQPVYQQPQPVYQQPAYQQTNMFGETAAAAAPQEPVAPIASQPYVTENGTQLSFDETPDALDLMPQAANTSVARTYTGETDSFIDTLTESEKVEFADVFINKNRLNVKGIPDYKMNDANPDFFPAVFVHINRFRAVCSDSLLSKMYKQLGRVM